jgi:lipoprotein
MKSKKLSAIVLLGLSIVWLAACGNMDGNMDVFEKTSTFNYAKVKMVDGQIVEGKVKKWSKWDGNIRVTFENGDQYYTHLSNVTLYNK